MYFALCFSHFTDDERLIDFNFLPPLAIDESILASLKKTIELENKAVALDKLSNLDDLIENEFIKKNSIDQLIKKSLNNRFRKASIVLFTEDKKIESPEIAYLKLHLISYRIKKPHQLNLDNLFASLPIIAWTSNGPIFAEESEQTIWRDKQNGFYRFIRSIDKFPPLTEYIVPQGVRIANTANVRLGAYLGSGTIIMHAGFVNFNAGLDGPNMVEGRVSAGVFVSKNSDIGGGASIMGTLSGGGDIIISIGKNCLIGANAGTGIALGDDCKIESGLYVTAGSKINLLNADGSLGQVMKARELSGQSGLTYRRNSLSGQLEALPNDKNFKLNPILHV